MEFDVELQYNPSDGDFSYVRFQNNIQSIFSRVRLLYGATPIEDIPSYNVIIRQLTEWTGTQGIDQFSISEGIGGVSYTYSNQADQTAIGASNARGNASVGLVNVRQGFIQGKDMTASVQVEGTVAQSWGTSAGSGVVPNASSAVNGFAANVPIAKHPSNTHTEAIHSASTTGNPVRRYQVQLMLGVFQQEKLIPTKFMASQLSIELTLENANACMYYRSSTPWTSPAEAVTMTLGVPPIVPPSYLVKNVNLIPEILEFDASYDETFLRGLQTGGVPIKFSTWNNYKFSQNGVSSLNLQIQERSRSVKSIFCLQRREPIDQGFDTGACFFNTHVSNDGASTLQEFQFRIGGR